MSNRGVSTKLGTVITYYKGERYISELLSSLRTALIYTRDSKESFSHKTVVVDDSSSEATHDGLLSLIDSSGLSAYSDIVLLKNNENKGVTLSRKEGIKCLYDYDFINIVDQDDILCKNVFVDTFRFCPKTDRKVILMFGAELINASGERLNDYRLFGHSFDFRKAASKCSKISTFIYGGNPIKTPGMLVFPKLSLKDILSFYDSATRDIDGSDDYILYIFLMKKGYRFLHTENIGLKYRVHETNQSKVIGRNFMERGKLGLKMLESIGIISNRELRAAFRRYSLLENISRGGGKVSKLVSILGNPVTSFRLWKHRV